MEGLCIFDCEGESEKKEQLKSKISTTAGKAKTLLSTAAFTVSGAAMALSMAMGGPLAAMAATAVGFIINRLIAKVEKGKELEAKLLEAKVDQVESSEAIDEMLTHTKAYQADVEEIEKLADAELKKQQKGDTDAKPTNKPAGTDVGTKPTPSAAASGFGKKALKGVEAGADVAVIGGEGTSAAIGGAAHGAAQVGEAAAHGLGEAIKHWVHLGAPWVHGIGTAAAGILAIVELVEWKHERTEVDDADKKVKELEDKIAKKGKSGAAKPV